MPLAHDLIPAVWKGSARQCRASCRHDFPFPVAEKKEAKEKIPGLRFIQWAPEELNFLVYLLNRLITKKGLVVKHFIFSR